MTDSKIPVTEDELHAFVDGELPVERRAASCPGPAGGTRRGRLLPWTAMNGRRTHGARLLVVLTSLALLLLLAVPGVAAAGIKDKNALRHDRSA